MVDLKTLLDFFLIPEYKMSSVHRAPSVTKQGNDFFVNIAAITNGTDTYNEAGAATSFAGLAGPYAASTLLVKDMGKTVAVSGATYRKVQVYSVAGSSDATLANLTFYILLNPATGNTCEWARMTLQA